jgi:integrase
LGQETEMTKIRLQYINSYKDRHGKLRYYFRRVGFQKVALPGVPGSAEFMQKYQTALASATPTILNIGAGRTRPGTIAAAVAGYFSSREFRDDLSANTKVGRRSILERFREQHGDGPVTLRQDHIEKMLDEQPTPATARLFFGAVRSLMQYCVRVKLRKDDPTQGIKRPVVRGEIYTWSDDDIAKFEAAHPVGSRARLAMALGLYTGQRNGDCIKLGWQYLRPDPQAPGRYIIRMRQQKTEEPLDIPVHPKLQAILDTVPKSQMVFLQTQYGRPYARSTAFSNWFRQQCDEAGLPSECSFHGLRKACSRRLAEAGVSVRIISAITGHRSLKEISRYTRAADQLKMARIGIDAVS